MQPRHRDNYEFLTQAPVSRVILTMAVPTIVSMLVTCFYVIVDTYFVGQLNTQSTAAVGIVFPLMSLIQAIGSFFGHGSGAYMARVAPTAPRLWSPPDWFMLCLQASLLPLLRCCFCVLFRWCLAAPPPVFLSPSNTWLSYCLALLFR